MSKKTLTIVRGVGAIGATVALMIGATFASLTSNTATLSNNNISSATASLKVWNGNAFSTTATGFTVTNLIPGQGSGDLPFYLQNDGGVALNITVHVPSAPSASGFTGWQNLHVTFKNEVGNVIIATNMADLLAGDVSLNQLAAGATGNSNVSGTPGNYTVNFDIDPSSVTGSQATVGNFDLVFTGTQ